MSVYDGATGGATPCVTTIPILHTHCHITHRANTTPRTVRALQEGQQENPEDSTAAKRH